MIGKEVSVSQLEKVDIYSFGMFLWELMSGVQPHLDPCIDDLDEFQIVEWCTRKRKTFVLPFFDNMPKFIQELIRLCGNLELFKRPSSSTLAFYFEEKKIT